MPLQFLPLPKGIEVVYTRHNGVFRMRILEATTKKLAFAVAEDYLTSLGFDKTHETIDLED